ncbi:MAG: hypothetical protein K2M31_00085 [Muribaculaceae bacterium]|nr:hypothetical protein [Muribaculaceae bacterium]
MKRIYLSLLMIISATLLLKAADAKKPVLMVFPSDDWCKKNGYILPGSDAPDYERALQNSDMDGAIAVMGDYLAEMGYPMFSLKQELKEIHNTGARRMVVTSKNDGQVMESDRDLVTRNVGCDFIVELMLDKKSAGARQFIEFKAQTIDAASHKILHGDIGTSSPSSSPTPLQVKEVVGGFIDNFCNKIDLAFTDIEKKGREGTITFDIADDSPYNFESDVTVDGESGELADFIEYWLSEHAVDENVDRQHKSRESLTFRQVRFPLFAQVAAGGFGSKKGKVKAQSMESFVKPLEAELRRLGMNMTTVPIGQGSVYCVIGGN